MCLIINSQISFLPVKPWVNLNSFKTNSVLIINKAITPSTAALNPIIQYFLMKLSKFLIKIKIPRYKSIAINIAFLDIEAINARQLKAIKTKYISLGSNLSFLIKKYVAIYKLITANSPQAFGLVRIELYR